MGFLMVSSTTEFIHQARTIVNRPWVSSTIKQKVFASNFRFKSTNADFSFKNTLGIHLNAVDFEQKEIELQEMMRSIVNDDKNKAVGASRAQKMLYDFVLLRQHALSKTDTLIDFSKIQHKDSFRIILDAWVNVSSSNEYSEYRAEHHAEDILAFYISDLLHHQSMQANSGQSVAKPLQIANNVDIFNRVLKAWSQNSSIFSVHRIMEILLYMERTEIAQRENEDILRTVVGQVDTVNYNVAMKAWSMSEYPWKAQKAFDLLCRMEQRSQTYHYITRCLPDIISFTTVIKACGKTNVDQEIYRVNALKILAKTWRKLKSYVNNQNQKRLKMNHSVYGEYLRSCSLLKADDDLCIQIFNEARDSGFVSKFVLESFRKAVPPMIFEDVTNLRDNVDIPLDWRLNVRDSKYRSRYFRS